MGSSRPHRPLRLFFLAVVLALGARDAAPETPRAHVRASLVSEEDGARPGRPLIVAVRLQTAPGWHTYWKNPGDSGLATRVQWQVPAGVVPAPLLWPVPQRYGTPPVVSYGHEGDVWFLAQLTLPSDLAPGATLRIGAAVQWLECQEECRPGRATLALTLPVRDEAPRRSPVAPLFAAARLRLPRPATGWRLSARVETNALQVSLHPPAAVRMERAYFFPAERSTLDHAAPQTLRREAGAYHLTLARDPNRAAPLTRLSGVLVTDSAGGPAAVEIDIPLASASP